VTDYRVVTQCRLCDSPNLTKVLELPDTPLANELGGTELFPLAVNRCCDCEHHQLSIAVKPERLWGPSYPYQSGTSPVFRAHLEKLADEVAALKPGGRVLEIASNDGTLVDMLHGRGLQSMGIDPSGEDAIMRGRYRGSWPDPVAISCMCGGGPVRLDRPDVIIALNVFAHVDDLHGFTAAVKEALAPDGFFIIEVGYLPAMIANGVFDTIYAEHMSYHTLNPLFAFFERHGLKVQMWTEEESQGGSLRVWVQHEDQPTLPQNRKWEKSVDITKLSERITLAKAGLALALQGAGTVAGYGCPAKLTTLMYATGLDRHAARFTCIYDDNPLKVGRSTPGTRIPIVPSATLMVDPPDMLILFAWNFASEIIPRLRAQGYRGRIVTPLPEVEIDEV
jgi:SAM-dependent methyltransferase